MPSRHRARQRALQILFQWDARRQPVDEVMSAYYATLYSEDETATPPDRDPFVDELVHGVVERITEIDDCITRHAEHWRLNRMPAVDRNVLRLAVFEMTSVGTPAPVAINEALELARRYSGEESVHFVNGVLDAVGKSLTEPAAEPGPPGSSAA